MSTSLNYASTTQMRVRLWPLALGASAIALGTTVSFASPYAMSFFLASEIAWRIFLALASLLGSLMILVGVALLALALAEQGGWVRGWKTYACLGLCAARLLVSAIDGIYDVAFTTIGGFGYQGWLHLIVALGCVSMLLRLVLLACAAVYLGKVGARLGRAGLGVIAACGLAPCALIWLFYLLYEMTHLPGLDAFPSMAVTFARFNTYYYESLNFTWFILLWSTIALFAAILALRQPR